MKLNNKTAIVTGAPGQDASYLCEYLLSRPDKEYSRVVGVIRKISSSQYLINQHMGEYLKDSRFSLYELDIANASGIKNLVSEYKPDEFYNLAAASHVGQSFKEPETALITNGMAVLYMLESIRTQCPTCKFYQAGTSEEFGNNYDNIVGTLQEDGITIELAEQSEMTPLAARSPYGASKIYARNMVRLYREAYGIDACAGILFNHESERRGLNFVTRKITNTIAKIKLGMVDHIEMGTLNTVRDFGYAPDYVRAMHLMLTAQPENDFEDFVVATGRSVSIRYVLDYVCQIAQLSSYNDLYKYNPDFYRPAEVLSLRGNPTKINSKLKWFPSINLETMFERMYENDLNVLKKLRP